VSRTITQRDWRKGLIAVTPDQDQPKNSIARISNLLYTRRGGLRTCDGSLIISLRNGTLQTTDGPWTEIFLFQPVNVSRYYIGIKKDLSTQLAAPTGLAVVDGGAGGTLAAATYRYEVTALDGAGGETTASAEVAFVNPGAHKANVSWNVVTNATGYNVYRTAAGGGVGTEVFITTVSTNAFVDDNSITPGTATPPTINSTQQVLFYRIPATSYTGANILATFPADLINPIDGTPGGQGGGGGGGGGSSGGPPTPQGGIVGNTSPLPQIVQFANKAFLALGNGFPAQIFTDPSTVTAISNTFTSVYPDWQTATIYAIGDIIKPSVNNAGGFIFKATQGGTSGGAAPTFPQTQNQQVADNKIIWQNIGLGSTVPAPRGAAHVVVYAGSLWVLNTNPTTTSDNLDGPSALRMSDLNNPTSWNPLNTAFLDRDDGDQGTGLAAMTIAESGIPPTGSLIAFKNFKTFQINGVFGSSNFSIQRAQTDMGCIAPRSIEFCPGFGIIRLSHLGFSLFDTTRDKVLSDDIRPFLFSDSLLPDINSMDWNFAYFSKAAQTADPPMYVAAIPIALLNLPSTGGATGFSLALVVDVASDWIQGNYFWRVYQAVGPSSFRAVSNEVQFNVFIAQRDVQFTPPSTVPAGVTGYRVFCGTSSGNYTRFQDCSATSPTTFIGFADMPNSGSPQVGTGGLTRLCCYDLVLKAWAIIDLPFSISVLRQVRAPGTEPITIIGGFNDGSVRRIQANDATWDGTPINWSFRPAEILGSGGTSRVFYERVAIRGLGDPSTIQLVPTYNGTDDVSQAPMNYTFGSNQFQSMLDLLTTAMNAHVTVNGSGRVEIDALDYEVEQLPAGAPPVFA
jgi:hypothetical protein